MSAESDKRLIGYTLIKRYPGCRLPLGHYEKLTTGEFSAWPEYWQPVYHGVPYTTPPADEKEKAWEETFGNRIKKIREEEPTGRGDRWNKGKLRWSLMDLDAMAPMIRVLEFGSKKYSDHNWKKGLLVSQLYESTMRHLQDLMHGEDNDAETKMPHTGHILCNAMFLSYMMLYRPEMDDRFLDPAKQLQTKPSNPEEEVKA